MPNDTEQRGLDPAATPDQFVKAADRCIASGASIPTKERWVLKHTIRLMFYVKAGGEVTVSHEVALRKVLGLLGTIEQLKTAEADRQRQMERSQAILAADKAVRVGAIEAAIVDVVPVSLRRMNAADLGKPRWYNSPLPLNRIQPDPISIPGVS